MVKARKYIVTKLFEGTPKVSDYQIVEEILPALKNGEILVKTEYVSVDPYLHNQFSYTNFNELFDLPYDQMGFQVGVVLDSKNPQFPVGTRVSSHQGWTDHYIGDPNAPVEFHWFRIVKIPDLKGLPVSYAVGAIGMPGASAYLGFLDVTHPKSGETVVVTGAAGAVGSIVGQIAKIKGCRVIGFAGTDEKVQWLEKDLGFDKALNYKTVDITSALKEAAPNGIDVYFDCVGGEISTLIMQQMNFNGRVSICGSISSYSKEHDLPKVTMVQPAILGKQLVVKGFAVGSRDADAWAKAFADLTTWIRNGQIKVREHVVEGFENIPEAFVGLFRGDNVGKAVVKI